MKIKRKLCYLIIDKTSLFCQGAFEHSKLGHEAAKNYLKKIDKTKKQYKIILK